MTFGQAHRSFRFDLRYRALLGGTRDQLEQQINEGVPFLPAGCSLQLDRVSSERSWRMLMALLRLRASADLRAELVELFALLIERTDHLVTPLDWVRADPPPMPLQLHGRYSRAEVFAAFGLLNEARPFPGREGVFCDNATQCDVFFITLKKSERLFSPTTRYNDVAISPWEFHWESKSLTREASATGQRYIHHVERGSRVTLPFLCLGFAEYVSHEGERPMAIRWRLEREIPAAYLPGCSSPSLALAA
ncbi:DUF3427 domain-containing protein [Cyanobium gracile]|uniref:DUF3427 domain-containing protein n=1 Tax=Cyanobium gracile UHCC 0281 TaxID=3110309 RepID=A0ABU5SZA9_9CYAN|nr:DUF3427 domain-containing protein [Cyanobium gracile]MEA5443863.1 DUF3427 domain-containing protein [Cyanobium gracile UHCC 0281]